MAREQCIDTIGVTERHFGASVTWGKWLKAGARMLADDFRTLLNVPVIWQCRVRDRNHLRFMTDRMLKDVGLCRVDVMAECGKPFWRA